MSFQMDDKDTWFGEGLLWKRLIIRNFFGEVQGILMDAVPEWIQTMEIDLSHCADIDQAIKEITKLDSDYYDELTLYADE
jgi:hypothetical protein